MLTLTVDQGSVDQTVEYLETVRRRIFEQVRLGMQEAMERLGVAAIEAAAGAGIQSHTGALAAGFQKYSVGENQNVIIGTITPRRKMTLKGRTFDGLIGTALDEGFHVNQVDGNLLQFSSPGEGTLYSRGHVAFDVQPHPFMRTALAQFEPTLIQIIAERVAAATEGE